MPPLSPEQRSLLTLHLIPGIGPRLTAALLAKFGTAEAILHATPEQLLEVDHIGPGLAEKFARAARSTSAATEIELMDKHQTGLLFLGSPGYPPLLATVPDPPPLLYVRGELAPSDERSVALVGSRRCSSYGLRVAERLAQDLVRSGVTVVSGLARGIDGAAHRAALKAGGRTLAVLAGGLSKIYPPEHAGLAEEVEAAGALITEATMTQEPMAGMFPARNRIISGLSRGVVIVEAAERSGALITARHAAEQGRPVFAIPGPIDSPSSAGALQLVRDGATMVRGVEDILAALGEDAAPSAAPAAVAPAMDPQQREVWDFLEGESRHIDAISERLGQSMAGTMTLLLGMEMKKLVKRLPGNFYERK